MHCLLTKINLSSRLVGGIVFFYVISQMHHTVDSEWVDRLANVEYRIIGSFYHENESLALLAAFLILGLHRGDRTDMQICVLSIFFFSLLKARKSFHFSFRVRSNVFHSSFGRRIFTFFVVNKRL